MIENGYEQQYHTALGNEIEHTSDEYTRDKSIDLMMRLLSGCAELYEEKYLCYFSSDKEMEVVV